MRVDTLKLHNFRNYVNLKLTFTHNINIFLGCNAQGKTNILEAIYFSAMGRSHRTSMDNELVMWQQPSCSINIGFSRMGVENELHFQLKPVNTRCVKEIVYNGHPIKPRDLMGSLNVVLFSPEDLLLIKGMPVARRHFLDLEISQASSAYYQQLLKYNRVLAQRNNLLKKIRERREKSNLLEAWDEQLAQLAAVIIMKRLTAVKKLTMLANLMHRKITASKENLVVQYEIHNLDDEEALTESGKLQQVIQHKLLSLRDNDILRGSTSFGPHRDDLVLTVNGINLRNFGSQGQQRTGVLALKLAELEFIKSETGDYPVLLLDDVMSELDEERRTQLLYFIKDRIQTFITATDEKYFPEIKQGKYYYVNNGQVAE
jgi:DNA replication and repair protein RecF